MPSHVQLVTCSPAHIRSWLGNKSIPATSSRMPYLQETSLKFPTLSTLACLVMHAPACELLRAPCNQAVKCITAVAQWQHQAAQHIRQRAEHTYAPCTPCTHHWGPLAPCWFLPPAVEPLREHTRCKLGKRMLMPARANLQLHSIVLQPVAGAAGEQLAGSRCPR